MLMCYGSHSNNEMCGNVCSRVYLGFLAGDSITQFFKKKSAVTLLGTKFYFSSFWGNMIRKHSTLVRLSVEFGKS